MNGAEEQLRVRVAWLYFMEGLTQGDIATQLGMTRLRVNRMLADARSGGLVSITLNSALTGCVALEHRLIRDFGLKGATIVPTPDDPDLVPVLLGQATGEFLSRYLEDNTVTGLGVGWGATLRESIRHVRVGRFPDLVVNSMMGGLTHGLEMNTFEIASALASRLGAQCRYLAAPIYAGSPDSRDLILAQDVFQETFQQIARNELALLSIGDLSDRSLLVRNGLPRDVSTTELAAHGAVGDVMGQFFDDQGKVIDHPLNRRAIASPLESLRQIPTVVMTSGGINKANAIAAVLKAGLGSVLICDEKTALAAVQRAGG